LGAGERRGQIVTVFGNGGLERGEEKDLRCLGTGCWREERENVKVFGNRVLDRGEVRI